MITSTSAGVILPLGGVRKSLQDSVGTASWKAPSLRKVIYTTDAIESVNARLRKIIKTRGHFPTDEAATKLIWLALRNITEKSGRAAHDWKQAMNQFAILYQERFEKAAA